MAWTYVAGSGDRDLVRLLISDTDETNPLLQDEELDAFLTLEDNDVRYAAAAALDTIATSEVLIQKKIKLLDLTTDGPAVAKALREHAAELRRQSAAGAFDWAEMVTGPFSYRERLRNQALRGAI